MKTMRRIRHLLRGVRHGMLPAYWRVAKRWRATRDAWAYVSHPVPHHYFGEGSKREFSWYLQGKSTVAVANLEDIQRWLLRCTYKRDEALFGMADLWQHPEHFEQLRQGDCEDHALWAWRKLRDLGIPARLFTGRRSVPLRNRVEFHAWIVLERNAEPFVFETTAFHIRRMLLPLDEVRDSYIPHYSIDHEMDVRMYCGHVKAG
ncbi:transglutaminase domain-containing protein [Arenimonas sp.]|uniref:transglutaminase domain-containing protein n=1 Tax=Arenimonas sp. TaxID=1872635 RepID=UPI0039E67151